ncbi:uncharacterized protein EAF02_007293 [Botrytis sinoallii]|uniref:uncharacterized protein n=1 Tax=Botrytis sinoallii TaxID=1463999 RepID=UPI001901CAAF|nr:uncharacterized protein EAF02_007293 [Botrytis sinoallii]KAF7880447.1 hypothetical protein EAF02_007293 [Botrytis sinoallii]
MEDFNIPSNERIVVLKALQEEIGNVPPYFWAFCQVCDLQALQKLTDIARISPANNSYIGHTGLYSYIILNQGTPRVSTPNTTHLKRGLGSSSTNSPLAKRQKKTDSPVSSPLADNQRNTNSPVSSPSLYRSKAASDLARDRDHHCCVLTGDSVVEVAHIYPFCRISTSEENIFGARHMFWEYLKNFWSEEKVAAWKAEIFSRGLSKIGDEKVDNRITLSKVAHAQWNRGAFALKPISIFFWQKKQTDIQSTMTLTTTPISTENLDHNEGAFDHGYTTLYCPGPKAIESGQIFELKTRDPIKQPLPSFKLLELQWALTRVVGMAGAAFPYEPSSGDDSDEDIPGLDLDEAGDTSVLSEIL